MSKRLKSGAGWAAVLLLGTAWASAFGGQAAAPPPPASEKNPAFRFTFTERIRQESSDNVTSLNEATADGSAYVRIRTSLMGQWRLAPDFEFTVRLTNENRYYLTPKTDPRIKKNFDLHEVFFDTLNLKWKNPAGLPLTLTAGRQDLRFGEGFLIMDGGPLDGSRSAYFNGVRLDWALGGNRTLTGFYVFQPATDTLLPVINDWGQKMIEQAEEGFGFYLSGAAKKWSYEGYLFRKNIRAIETAPDSRIDNLGGRVQVPFTQNLSLTAEAAVQFGRFGVRDRTGFGGYFHLDQKTGAKFPLPAQITLGGIFLSGDDPATNDRYEGWDPAFSRWPKWSDSQIYLFGRESKPAFWTNYASLYATAVFAVADTVNLALTWHHLRAPQETPATAFLSGAGRARGDLGIAKLTFDISPHLQGHFLWEQFRPGDYYFPGAQGYAWIRFEVLFRY